MKLPTIEPSAMTSTKRLFFPTTLEQGLLVMPPRGDHEAPDVALAEQQVMMLDQPRTGAPHELGLVEDGGRFPTKIGYEPAFGMQREFAAFEQPECRGMADRGGLAG
jgi:hypothetical protein